MRGVVSFQLAPKDSPMQMSWEKMVVKDPVGNLPSSNDDALDSVLKGDALIIHVSPICGAFLHMSRTTPSLPHFEILRLFTLFLQLYFNPAMSEHHLKCPFLHSGKYAFFANKEYIIYRLQRILPIQQAMDIVDTKTDFLRRGIGFGLQKHSPYKHLFNHVYVCYKFNIPLYVTSL